MAITGHSSRSTFDRYSKVDEADLRHAIERLEVYSDFNRLITIKSKKESPTEAELSSATT
jgi:hypothetical protein